ncbi:MAG: phosphatidate cytidylyltransferase [Nitrospirae bacterium]|nr:phosphatidate cytidylyltransferase [Nitrospirota bacterium]
MKRLLTALLLLPPLYLLLQYGPPWAFLLLVCLAVLVGQWELYRMFAQAGVAPLKGAGYALGVLTVLAFYFQGSRVPEAIILIPMTLLVLLGARLWTGGEIRLAWQDVALTLFGVFYVAWLLGFLIRLRDLEGGVALLLLLFLVTWVGDSAAFFVGSTWGRRPLAPAISPKKTWEGALGGFLAGLATTWGAGHLWLPPISLADTLLLGTVLGVLTQLGDLTESLLKRGAGVKDSSSLLPGHGGLLDTVDSLLFSSPALYYFAVYVLGIRPPV